MPDPFAKPVLSLFPNVGLLDRAFEEAGFCVVRGPDILWGGDVRRFHPPAGVFGGIIGGPPCQDFSAARRAPPTGEGLELLREYCRVVRDAAPDWFLCENVPRVPDVEVAGYFMQRLDVDQRWFVDVSRLRHIQFGSRRGELLHIDRRPGRDAPERHIERAALASDGRSVAELIRLQGLPADFDLPGFTVEEKKRAIGNGVPLAMGRVLAAAVVAALTRGPVTMQLTLDGAVEPSGVCVCGCGRTPKAGRRYYDFRCRKEAQRKRDDAAGRNRENRKTKRRRVTCPVSHDAGDRDRATSQGPTA
ncbi:MAG: DNA cytosine methyltransferase [Pirellulales bacterium]